MGATGTRSKPLLGAAAAAALAGCVSFSDVGPAPARHPQAAAEGRVAHVRLTSSAWWFQRDQRRRREVSPQEAHDWPEHARRAVAQSGWFARVAPYRRLASHEVAVDVLLESEANQAGHMTLLTLGLIPTTYRQKLRVELRVEGPGGRSPLCRETGDYRAAIWSPALPFVLTHGVGRIEARLLRRLVRTCMDEAALALGWAREGGGGPAAQASGSPPSRS